MTLTVGKVLLAALPALALIAGHAHAFAALPTSPPWTCLHRRIGTPPTAPGSSYSLAWQAWLPAGARPTAGGKPRRWRAACVRAAEEGVSGGQREEIEGVEVCFKDVEVSEGVVLKVAEAGREGAPVCCLLHGFPDFWLTWRSQIPALVQAGYKVIMPDLRGYGGSSKPQGVASYGQAELCGDVEVLRSHYCGDGPFSLLAGHDWGGGVAWAASIQGGAGLAERLAVLACPHPLRFRQGLTGVLEQQVKSWYIAGFQVPVLPEIIILALDAWLLKRTFSRIDPAPPAQVIERHIEECRVPLAMRGGVGYYRATGAGLWPCFTGTGWAENPLSRACQFLGGVQQARVDAGRSGSDGSEVLSVPTLVIYGSADLYMAESLGRPPAESVPECRYVVMKAGHWLHWEQPRAVNDELLRFMGN